MFKFIQPISIAGCILFASVAHAQSMHGTYTINNSSPTTSTNFNSFNDAVAALSTEGVDGAVTFNIASATYSEQVLIPAITGSSAANRITFEGNGAAVEYIATVSSNRAVIKLNGANYITLNNLNITAQGDGASQYGYGIHLINNADNNIVNRCNIEVSSTASSASVVNNYVGILVNSSNETLETEGNAQCDNNTFSNNTVSGGYHGIALVANGTTHTISNNKITDNKIVDFFRAGIYLNGNDSTLVKGNDISRPNRSTGALFYGIQLQNSSVNTLITANRIHDPFAGSSTPNSVSSGANGIVLINAAAASGRENTFSNNLVYGLNCGSIVRGIWLSSSSYNKFINNTVSIDDTGFSGFAGTTGFEITGSTDLTIINNIVDIGRNASFVDRYAINIASTLRSDIGNNNFTINPGSGPSGPTGKIGRVGSTNCIDISAWATASGDATSISVSPDFTDISTGDFTPTNDLLQAGTTTTTTGVTTDILGLGRSTTAPTIGAYEIDGTVLPVFWSALEATRTNEGFNKLDWTTFKEINNRGFAIQRSADAKGWLDIAFTTSQAIDGNSDKQLGYTFLDKDYNAGISYYRIVQQDIDGAQKSSNIVMVSNGNKAIATAKIYPNPATSVLYVKTNNTFDIQQLSIVDFSGKGYYVSYSNTDGILKINTEALPAGNYLLSLISEGKQQIERFSIVK